jgi:hypothetical protein
MKPKRSRLQLSKEDYAELCERVYHRDKFRCQIPGCIARGNLHAHHVVFRSRQGDDAEWNLITICDVCHRALHDHRLVVIIPAEGFEKIDCSNKDSFRIIFTDLWRPGKGLPRRKLK